MKSSELAAEVMAVVIDAQARITGVGADQYVTLDEHGNEVQKFEGMDLNKLLVMFEEELLDEINYATMNIIRFRRWRAQLGKFF